MVIQRSFGYGAREKCSICGGDLITKTQQDIGQHLACVFYKERKKGGKVKTAFYNKKKVLPNG